MSVQDILDKKADEIKLLYDVIMHPAGFIIDLFGNMLYIRSTNDDYEVGWETLEDGQVCDWHKSFQDPLEAVTFFVEKRHERQLGVDFEIELMKEKHNE
jgi:hypothetical protein